MERIYRATKEKILSLFLNCSGIPGAVYFLRLFPAIACRSNVLILFLHAFEVIYEFHFDILEVLHDLDLAREKIRILLRISEKSCNFASKIGG